MAEPFLGEIRIMSFNFAPKGWALCNGQLLPINQNQALFSLLGTTYGGNGRVNFALPDLRGRVPMHAGERPHPRRAGRAGGSHAHQLRSCRRTTTRSSAVNANAQRRRRRELSSRPRTRCTSRRRQHDARAEHDRPTSVGRSRTREPAAVPDAELLHRTAGHLPLAELERGREWLNHTSARFGCSQATSRRRAGCSATARAPDRRERRRSSI